MNHTPEPYRAEKFAIKAIDHGQWYTVARTMSSKLTDEGNQNNAEFIVRACNAHYELVEACQLLLGTVDDFLPNIGNCVLQDYGRLNDGLIKGRAAIAKTTNQEGGGK